MRRRSIVALGLGAPSSACPVALRLTVVALLLLLLAAAASAQDKTVDSSPPGENVPPSGTVAHAQAGAEPSAPPSPSAPAANEDTATAAEAERREAEERNTLTRALHLQQLAEAKDKLTSSSTQESALHMLSSLSVAPQLNELTSTAHMALGDFHAGLLETPKTPLNLRLAFAHYSQAVQAPFAERGRAHYMLAFLMIYHPEAVSDQYRQRFLPGSKEPATPGVNAPLAMLHLTMAAKDKFDPAMLSLAAKHLRGLHTLRSCRHAADLMLDVAADVVAATVKLGSETVKLEDEFAAGKSVMEEEKELLHYYRYTAERVGGREAKLAMGILHQTGFAHGVPKDATKALHYFLDAASAHVNKKGEIVLSKNSDANAVAHLANLYLKGEGVPASNDTAVSLLLKAAQQGSSLAQTRLGLCYLKGECDLDKNIKEARRYFTEAATQEEPEALYQLGKMSELPVFGAVNVHQARLYYQRAAQGGHFPAFYELALVSFEGIGIPPNCEHAAALLRKLFDRTVHKDAAVAAYREYNAGRLGRALIRYEMAADQGHLLSLQNTAWLYDVGYGTSDLGYNMSEVRRQLNTLHYYREAAAQESATANLKLGDIFFYGRGVPAEPARAALYYQQAATLRNAQAAFNLGYMHHRGVGLPQDFHLAKRYYDQAMELSPTEARLPSLGALLWLQLESALLDLGNENEDAGVLGLLARLGLAWDSLLLIVLALALLLALMLRLIVR